MTKRLYDHAYIYRIYGYFCRMQSWLKIILLMFYWLVYSVISFFLFICLIIFCNCVYLFLYIYLWIRSVKKPITYSNKSKHSYTVKIKRVKTHTHATKAKLSSCTLYFIELANLVILREVLIKKRVLEPSAKAKYLMT